MDLLTRKALRAPQPSHYSNPTGPLVLLRRLLGCVLLVFAVVPLYRLLDPSRSGLAAAATKATLDIYADLIVAGLLLLVPVALLGARLVTPAAEQRLRSVACRVAAIDVRHVAAAAATIGFGVALIFGLFVLDGKPNMIDAFAQVLHARYIAEGLLAGPVDDGGGFFSIQNSLFTERGWVSQYPPGHVLLLAAFFRLGVPWLLGPVLVGVTVFFATLAAARLLPERPAIGRMAGLLLAVSPFFFVIGASYLNNITTAAGVTIAAWALLKAWQERMSWAFLAGAAFGLALVTRPLSTVAMATALTLLVPFVTRDVTMGRFARCVGFMVIGSLPFVSLLLAYNTYFFGHPLVFGYEIAMGPQMRLGFLRDPWGNIYGLREAIAYTSADLIALGLNLFENPLSAVAVIAMFLVAVPRLTAGERVLLGWAIAPIVTNFFYWHHSNFMGPRMVHEAAPAWVLLFAAAAIRLVQLLPSHIAVGTYSLRGAVVALLIGSSALGLLVLTPQRVLSYGGTWHSYARAPAPEVQGLALVFVHDGWMTRIASTLISAGYRLDLLETLMRQNSTCRLQQLAEAVRIGDVTTEEFLLASMDTIARSQALTAIVISPDNLMRVSEAEVLISDCQQQVLSDRRGVIDLTSLLWRGDITGGAARGAMFARDFGPERNAVLLARHPDRRPWVYMLPEPESNEPVLLPYSEGMRRLWPHATGLDAVVR
jgi:hypothetical protein